MSSNNNDELTELRTVAWIPLMGKLKHSSAWIGRPWWHKLTWITLLMSTNRHGYVELTLSALARDAEVTLEQARDAIDWYSAPDPNSQNPAHEGRHISPVAGGGWKILNHAYYRTIISSSSRKEYQRDYMARRRAGKL